MIFKKQRGQYVAQWTRIERSGFLWLKKSKRWMTAYSHDGIDWVYSNGTRVSMVVTARIRGAFKACKRTGSL